MPSDNAAALQRFIEMLTVLHRGDLAADILDNISAATDAARSRKKPSKVQITLTFVPAHVGMEDDDVLHITGTSKVTLPPVQRGQSTWFVWSDGSVRRERELQPSMFDDSPRLVSGTVIRAGESEPPQRSAAPPADFDDDRRFA